MSNPEPLVTEGVAIIGARAVNCQFVGSFFALDQLPRDRRPQVALAGRSNVGKSSMLNRLVGRKNMAKVSSTPGKTRSLNFFLMNNRYYLVDLPGYGYAKVSKGTKKSWQKLIGDYLESSSQLIGLVLLLDIRREPNPEDQQLMAWLATRKLPTLIAVTKADKVNRGQVNTKVASIENFYGLPAIPFSTVSGIGKNELMGSIEALVNGSKHKTEVPRE